MPLRARKPRRAYKRGTGALTGNEGGAKIPGFLGERVAETLNSPPFSALEPVRVRALIERRLTARFRKVEVTFLEQVVPGRAPNGLDWICRTVYVYRAQLRKLARK